MALRIAGLAELRERLERLRVEEVMARALAAQAERVADAVREGLFGTARMRRASGIYTVRMEREPLIMPVRLEEKEFQSRFAGAGSKWK